MPDNLPELDRLLHETTFFPGLNIRLASLPSLMKITEQQLESGRKKEITRLRLEHQRLGDENLHPDDREYEIHELESQVTHYLPKMFRGGYVLTLWSVLERSLMDITRKSASHTGTPLPEDYFRKGSFFPAMRNAIRLCSGVNAFPNRDEYKKLNFLKSVRQTLIHHDGRIKEAPASLQNLTHLEIEKMGLILEKDYDFTFIVPTEHFLEENTEIVITCIRRIASQVYDTLNP
jgi:hypothetical protein